MSNEEKAIIIAKKMDNANKALEKATILIGIKMWDVSVNRIYYACFYAVNALLINSDIKARKHSGVIQMFGLHFVNTGIISKEMGKFYTLVFDMRQSSDYNDDVEFGENDVLPLLVPAKQFIKQIEEILSGK